MPVLIRRYVVTGIYGGTSRRAVDLCEYHANITKRMAREVKPAKTEAATDAKCDDCRPAKPGPTVLDRVISKAEKAEAVDEPKPVPVLPGQRRLF